MHDKEVVNGDVTVEEYWAYWVGVARSNRAKREYEYYKNLHDESERIYSQEGPLAWFAWKRERIRAIENADYEELLHQFDDPGGVYGRPAEREEEIWDSEHEPATDEMLAASLAYGPAVVFEYS